MANKKGFVRYANNKLVAGSLILADKAPKVGVWKEVPADLCCTPTNGGCCDTPQEIIYILENNEPYDEGVSIQLNINCYSENPNDPTGGFSLFKELDTPLTTPPTFPEIIDLINQYFGSAGLTATLIDENSASVTTSNTAFFACLCVNGQREISVEINSPG
jgi:hypothetical protein